MQTLKRKARLATVAAVWAVLGVFSPALAASSPQKLETIDFSTRRPKPETLENIVTYARMYGSARVVLGVPVRFTPEGLLSASGIDAQRRNIARAQERLLSSITGLETLVWRFKTIPYLVAILNATGAENLGQLEGLASADLEREIAPSLDSTTPIIGATTAAERGFTGIGQTIAILDTGVDAAHPFLAGAVVDEACFSTSQLLFPPLGDCPLGLATQYGPGAAAPLPSNIDGFDHGTHVAGIAAGRGAPAGVSFNGTAPDATIMAIQVFHRADNIGPIKVCGDRPSPCVLLWPTDALYGLEYVRLRHSLFSIAAVNMSFGGGAYTEDCFVSVYLPAVINLLSVGTASVAASGNESLTNALIEPACVPGVVSVGATVDSDVVAGFSNSAPFLDLLAPGVSVNSSVPGGGFQFFSGTSMAAPHVAGSFALLKQGFPSSSIGTLEQLLKQTGKLILDTKSGVTTPRIDVAQALIGAGEFDVRFYLDQYPDLKEAFGDNYVAATDHWITIGLPIEGRRGSREFDVKFYLDRYPDLKAAFGNDYGAAMNHWVSVGLPTEGRRGSREFDVKFYLDRYPDLKAAFGDDYRAARNHWVSVGLPVEGRQGSRELDLQFYRKHYPDLEAAYPTDNVGLIDHWIITGLPVEGRRASRELDLQFYRNYYPDLKAAYPTDNVGLIDHWIITGLPVEGRRGSQEFAVRFYLDRYPDLKEAFGTDYPAVVTHWVVTGLPVEGRRAALDFDVRFYLDYYPDLKEAFGDDYLAATDHWINQGYPNEGRIGAQYPSWQNARFAGSQLSGEHR